MLSRLDDRLAFLAYISLILACFVAAGAIARQAWPVPAPALPVASVPAHELAELVARVGKLERQRDAIKAQIHKSFGFTLADE